MYKDHVISSYITSTLSWNIVEQTLIIVLNLLNKKIEVRLIIKQGNINGKSKQNKLYKDVKKQKIYII